MKVSIKKEGTETVVTVGGRLDTVNAAEFQQKMDDMPDADAAHVTVDCAEMEYISSSGLRAFISLLKRAGRLGGKVSVKNLNSSVREVFDMTGFSSLFGIE